MFKWYVDRSHNVHWDCMGHEGAVFTMGNGATSSYSRKLKANTRISTTTKLFTVDMFMPEMLWTIHFMEAQGYEVECVGLYQDNISTQLLVKNGKMSSKKKTKNIKAKFFFIKDRVYDGEIKVIGCPTEEMWGGIMTKPLPGTTFHVFRAELMTCLVNYEDPTEEVEPRIKQQPIPASRTVTCKSVVAQPSRHRRSVLGRTGIRHHGRTKFYVGINKEL